MVVLQVLAVLGVIILVAILFWVHGDARRRGMSGPLWVAAILFGGLAPFLIYLAIRDKFEPHQPA